MDLCFLAFVGALGCFSATVFFPFCVCVDSVSVSLLDLVVTLNCRSREFVDPRLLNFHLRSELPDSAVFLEDEVPQAVVVDLHARMNVEVLAHAI